MSRNLLIRVDASTLIGTGHAMRCLALAQAWRQSCCGHVTFVAAELSPSLETRLAAEGFETLRLSAVPGDETDAAGLLEIAQEQDVSWIVVDGYRFGGGYQRALKAAGTRLLFVDDYGHADEYFADLVLNQNLTADASLYDRREPHTRLLLGPRHVLLRQEFLRWIKWKRETPKVARKVLVTLGGSDSENVTNTIIQALSAFRDIEAVIVVGGSNPHLASLSSSVSQVGSWMRVEKDVRNMTDLMAWADVGITAGGSTFWEMAFMGLPNLVLVLADHQRPIAERSVEFGMAVALGLQTSIEEVAVREALQELLRDTPSRQAASEKCRGLVDGQGTARVLAAMTV